VGAEQLVGLIAQHSQQIAVGEEALGLAVGLFVVREEQPE